MKIFSLNGMRIEIPLQSIVAKGTILSSVREILDQLRAVTDALYKLSKRFKVKIIGDLYERMRNFLSLFKLVWMRFYVYIYTYI